ncbi:hypothetical protein [Micromonospora coerulea]|uniref:hypothetical protein n=1 Tax=Micromonospora coerulea TaxID=47856 RepID=UPI00190598D5|nr:hypothetical protein [Micromonospora veneta]
MTLQIVSVGAAPPPAQPAAEHQNPGPTLDPMATGAPTFAACDAVAPPIPTGTMHCRELHVKEIQGEMAPGVLSQ